MRNNSGALQCCSFTRTTELPKRREMLDMSRANVDPVVAELLQERPDIDFDTVIAKRHADQRWKNIVERFHSTAKG